MAGNAVPAAGDAAYWCERVREETKAALACNDARAAAAHVALATQCLRRAQQSQSR